MFFLKDELLSGTSGKNPLAPRLRKWRVWRKWRTEGELEVLIIISKAWRVEVDSGRSVVLEPL